MLAQVFSVIILFGVSSSLPIESGSCEDGLGVYLLETYVPCSLLVEEGDVRNDVWGVYVARETLCRAGNHECCRTCKHVLQEEFDEGTCVDEPLSIQIADGGYDCTMLLERGARGNSVMGIYTHRVAICSRGVHQCCRACQEVYDQEGISIPRTTTTTTTTTPAPTADPTTTQVTKAVPTESGCKDEFVPFNSGSLGCDQLVSPDSQVYNLRQALCRSQRARCCLTCSHILQANTDTSQGGVTYDTDTSQGGATYDTDKTQDGGSDSDVTIVTLYSDVIAKLDAMESKIHTKVDELQEEVDVLFDSFRQ